MCTAEEQEIPLQDYTMYILPEDREIFGKWLAQNLQGNTENSIDYRILFKKRIFYIRLKTFSHEASQHQHNGRRQHTEHLPDKRKCTTRREFLAKINQVTQKGRKT